MNLSFFGAAPDTGNLGVTALCYATLYGLQKITGQFAVTVFDHGRGARQESIAFPETEFSFDLQGAVNSRRYYRPENLKLMKFLSKLGLNINAGLEQIKTSDAVLDISGGDSFTDLYGSRRFETVTLPKKIAIEQSIPLILLPQTYGPFKTEKCRYTASEIVKHSRCAWARDERSFSVLKDLLGDEFDPVRHQVGVDVAFGLPSIKPSGCSEEFFSYLINKDTEKIGINISGLIYNDEKRAKTNFGFKADYRQVVLQLVNRFLRETDSTIFLVPHVITPRGHYESDEDSCYEVLHDLSSKDQKRVVVVPAFENPCEMKWVISQLDWFCGTRMHATIAALSSATPVAAISYSPKTLGVFETCGQGENVADPTVQSTDQVTKFVWDSWVNRKKAENLYKKHLPQVQNILNKQFSSFIDNVEGSH